MASDTAFFRDLSRKTQTLTVYFSLLGKDEADKIEKLSFAADDSGQRVEFNAARYKAVAEAIASGRIASADSSNAPGGGSGGLLKAAYSMNDKMYGNMKAETLSDHATMFHEMTHAIVDMSNANLWTKQADEATAFVAQTAFMILNGSSMANESKGDPLAEKTFNLTTTIVRETGIGYTVDKAPAPVVSAHRAWPQLLAAVTEWYTATQWGYQGIKGTDRTGADGLNKPPTNPLFQ